MTATALDLRMTALAVRLLNQYGKEVTYTREVAGAYDTETGTATPTTTTATVKVYVSDKKMSPGNTLVQAGDVEILLAGLAVAFVPTPTDKFTIDGAVYVLVAPATAVYSGELVALWRLHARK